MVLLGAVFTRDEPGGGDKVFESILCAQELEVRMGTRWYLKARK